MSLDVTGGHLALITLIIMVGLGMMWFEYLNFNTISNESQSDYTSCVNSCSRFSSAYTRMESCQIRWEKLSVCIETDKGNQS